MNNVMEPTNQHRFDTEVEFNTISGALPVMVRACNTAGMVIYSNAASKQLCEDEQDWFTKVHQEYKNEYEEAFAYNSQLKIGFRLKYKFKTGKNDHLLADQAFPWYSLAGHFMGYVCYSIIIEELVDVTLQQSNHSPSQTRIQSQVVNTLDEELHIPNFKNSALDYHFSQAQRNLEQIINMLPASVVIIRGYDLIVEMINNSNLAYWNKTKEQVLGKPFLEILPDLAEQPFAEQLRRVMNTGEIIDVKESPVLFTNQDGSTRETYVDYTYQPLLDLQGNRTGVLVMSFEITERVLAKRVTEKYAADLAQANTDLVAINQELALSEARFKYLIHEAPVAIGILQGRELVIESANQMILEVWGKSPEIIGLPLSIALPELEGQPFLDILDRVYITGEAFYANEIRSVLEHQGELKRYSLMLPISQF
jgi:PAS domain S-box-containing protein